MRIGQGHYTISEIKGQAATRRLFPCLTSISGTMNATALLWGYDDNKQNPFYSVKRMRPILSSINPVLLILQWAIYIHR